MKPAGSDPKQEDERSVLTMPNPPSDVERWQAKIDVWLKQMRISPSVLKITVLGPGENGEGVQVDAQTPHQELAEAIIKHLTIKLFTGDEPKLSLIEVRTEATSPHQPPRPKLWTGDESKRRSKPKGDGTPDLPG